MGYCSGFVVAVAGADPWVLARRRKPIRRSPPNQAHQ